MKEFHVRRTCDTDWSTYYEESPDQALIEFFQDELMDGKVEIEIRDPSVGPMFKVFEVEATYTCMFTAKVVPEEEP